MTRQGAIDILVLHCMAGVADLGGDNDDLMRLASIAIVTAFRTLDVTDPELDAAMDRAGSIIGDD